MPIERGSFDAEKEQQLEENDFLNAEVENFIKDHGYSKGTKETKNVEERKIREEAEREEVRKKLLEIKDGIGRELLLSEDKEKDIQRMKQENLENLERAEKILENPEGDDDAEKNAKENIELLKRKNRILEHLFNN